MSGVAKSIGKVFKAVTEAPIKLAKKGIEIGVNIVKDYWPYIAIAVAAYFTAGAALGWFGAAGATGATAGAAGAGTAAATGTAYSSAAAGVGAAAPAAAPAAGGGAISTLGAGAIGGGVGTGTGAGFIAGAHGVGGAAAPAVATTAKGGLISSVLGGMTKYWPVTMMGGQMLAGLGQSMVAKEQQKQMLDEQARQFDVGRTYPGSFYGQRGRETAPLEYAGPQVPSVTTPSVQPVSQPEVSPETQLAGAAQTPRTINEYLAMRAQGLVA